MTSTVFSGKLREFGAQWGLQAKIEEPTGSQPLLTPLLAPLPPQTAKAPGGRQLVIHLTRIAQVRDCFTQREVRLKLGFRDESQIGSGRYRDELPALIGFIFHPLSEFVLSFLISDSNSPCCSLQSWAQTRVSSLLFLSSHPVLLLGGLDITPRGNSPH